MIRTFQLKMYLEVLKYFFMALVYIFRNKPPNSCVSNLILLFMNKNRMTNLNVFISLFDCLIENVILLKAKKSC